jgi:hyperosmotically inducible periplasmic protein
MKVRFPLVAAFGMAGLLAAAQPYVRAASVQASSPQSTEDKDDALEDQIGSILKKDSMLAPRKIDVEAKDGHVTLTGTVRTETEKSRAGLLANVTGVTGVDNKILVNPNADKSKVDAAADKTKAGVDKAVDATKGAAHKTTTAVEKGANKTAEGVSKAAGKTSEAAAKAEEKAGDAALTGKVKASFANEPLLKETAIDVDTVDSVVTLKGTVTSSEAKMRAGTLAIATTGVTRVDNQLVVLQ